LKDIDNIEDWYRDELNNYNVEPDTNIWNSLSGELDANTPLTDDTFSDWYKKEVAKLEERPDYTVWEKLSTQLDTASVWDKLSVSLTKYDQLIWWRNAAIRGAAVLLFCFGSYLTLNNYSASNEKLTINESTVLRTKSTDTNNRYTSNQRTKKGNKNSSSSYSNSLSTPKETTNSSNSFKEANTIINKEQSIASSNKNIRQTVKNAKSELVTKQSQAKEAKNSEEFYASKKEITKLSRISIANLETLKTTNDNTIFTEINRHQISEKDISHLLKDGEYLVKKDNDKIVFNSKRFSSYSMFGVYARRVYAGFNFGVKKQGMITSIKEDSPLANYNQSVFLDFGTNFGGTVGYILSDNINLEANVNLNSTSGYKRTYTNEGASYQENLNLDYTTISLLAKKMNNKSTFDNKVYSTNIIAGAYASYLRSSTSDINEKSQNIDTYNKTDYGFVLGIEQDRYITKTLVITPGIRYNQGLVNIANSDNAFETSRNFSFEFNLGVKYIFLKKGK
jgi:hypothetical protein